MYVCKGKRTALPIHMDLVNGENDNNSGQKFLLNVSHQETQYNKRIKLLLKLFKHLNK